MPGDGWFNDIGGVKAAAKSDLDDLHFNVLRSKGNKRHGSQRLKCRDAAERTIRVDRLNRGFDNAGRVHEILLGTRVTVDGDPLPDGVEMGGGKQASAVAGGGEGGGKQGAGTALALGTRDVQRDGADVGVIKAVQEFTDAVEIPAASSDWSVGAFGIRWFYGRKGALKIGHTEEPRDGLGVVHGLSIGRAAVQIRSATMRCVHTLMEFCLRS